MRIFDIPDAVRVIFVREKITFSLSPQPQRDHLERGKRRPRTDCERWFLWREC